jgi:hypothetical protein
VLRIADFQPIDSLRVRSKINELRRGIGEGDIAYDVVNLKGVDVLRESALCDIHGIKTSGDHFIRFNLNGGDSYAYYIDLRSPELIRNFKGEPFLKTEDAAPDLWKKLRKVAAAAVQKQPLEDNAEVLAFYDTLHGSAVKIGVYLPISRQLTLNSASEKAAAAWLAEYGLIQTGFLPHMNVVFDPTLDVQYIPGDTTLNTFRATEYMMRPKTETKSKLSNIPPTINKLLRSVLGNPTDEIYWHFVNWLAYIFHTRTKATTAWVFSGTEGTGKGAFVQFVLRPIFGSDNVRVIQYGLFQQEFNGFLENSLFVVCDEADMTAAQNASQLEAKLRHFITDSPIEIRKMRTDPFTAPNFSNFIFNSNKRTPVTAGGNDRRYNIAEYQPDKLFLTPNELLVLQSGSELEAFADTLVNWPVDEVKVRQLIDTQTRRDVHEAGTSINQLIADAIVAGDLQFFIDRTPSDMEVAADFHSRFNPIGLFRAKIDGFIETARKGEAIILKDEDVFPLFRTLIPDARYFHDTKIWRTRHYKALGLDFNKKHRVSATEQSRGLRVQWKLPTDMPARAADATNVIPMKKGKKK